MPSADWAHWLGCATACRAAICAGTGCEQCMRSSADGVSSVRARHWYHPVHIRTARARPPRLGAAAALRALVSGICTTVVPRSGAAQPTVAAEFRLCAAKPFRTLAVSVPANSLRRFRRFIRTSCRRDSSRPIACPRRNTPGWLSRPRGRMPRVQLRHSHAALARCYQQQLQPTGLSGLAYSPSGVCDIAVCHRYARAEVGLGWLGLAWQPRGPLGGRRGLAAPCTIASSGMRMRTVAPAAGVWRRARRAQGRRRT